MSVELWLLYSLGWSLVEERVEEPGCQAYEKLTPSESVCGEVVFSQRESNTSYRSLRILDLAYSRDPEREV
jgi:hypothetical protein